MINKVTTTYLHEMSFEANIDDFKIILSSGGEGPGPKKIMLASLGGCTGLDVVSVLNKMRVEFSDFSVETEANLTEEHPKIYDQVTITYKIKTNPENQSKVEKAIALSIEKYCGVMEMFKSFASLNIETVFL